MFIPVIQKELDTFSSVNWIEHLGRKQKDKILPTGIPKYENPEEFGGIQCGIPIDEDLLEKVNDKLDIMTEDHDWMCPELRELCEELLPHPEDIPPSVRPVKSTSYSRQHWKEVLSHQRYLD